MPADAHPPVALCRRMNPPQYRDLAKGEPTPVRTATLQQW